MLISILWYPPCWTLNMKFPAIFSRLVVRERSARGNTNQTTTLKHGILLLRYGVRKIQRLIDLSCLCVNARKRANHLSWKVTRITLDEWFIILRVYLHKRTYDFFVTLIRGNFFDVILKFLGVQRIWYIRLDGLSIPNINSPFAPSINGNVFFVHQSEEMQLVGKQFYLFIFTCGEHFGARLSYANKFCNCKVTL